LQVAVNRGVGPGEFFVDGGQFGSAVTQAGGVLDGCLGDGVGDQIVVR
jgi:hypothetical protein